MASTTGPDPQPDAAFFRDLVDTMSDGVYFVDRTRTITYWSRGAERLTGYSSAEVLGRRCRDQLLNHVDDDGQPLCGNGCPLKATMQDGQPREARIWMHHRDGHRQPVWVRGAPLYDADGAIVGAVETFSDDRAVAAIREQLAEAQQLALTDELTGVGNRRYLEMALAARIDERARYGWPAGVLFVDVDHFKAINDRYGHEVGDRLLAMIARSLVYGSRASELVARYGGEEFVVLLPHVDASGLVAAAERLRVMVASSELAAGDGFVRATVSVGATLLADDDTAEVVLRRADAMLFAAKAAGRNCTRSD
jgi:diguanylate cyclase (GGDEF)-like protein/PAS domain S-box-containing protein